MWWFIIFLVVWNVGLTAAVLLLIQLVNAGKILSDVQHALVVSVYETFEHHLRESFAQIEKLKSNKGI